MKLKRIFSAFFHQAHSKDRQVELKSRLDYAMSQTAGRGAQSELSDKEKVSMKE